MFNRNQVPAVGNKPAILILAKNNGLTIPVVSHDMKVRNQKVELSSIPFRYVWPSELDLMARIANLKLKARWGSWKKEAFANNSRYHVSVWEKPLNKN